MHTSIRGVYIIRLCVSVCLCNILYYTHNSSAAVQTMQLIVMGGFMVRARAI